MCFEWNLVLENKALQLERESGENQDKSSETQYNEDAARRERQWVTEDSIGLRWDNFYLIDWKCGLDGWWTGPPVGRNRRRVPPAASFFEGVSPCSSRFDDFPTTVHRKKK